MCRDCGCEEANHEHKEVHEHLIDGKLVRHTHTLLPRTPRLIEGSRKLRLEESVLAKNDRIADENRKWFASHGVIVLNLISSPGSGKTFLLEKTARKIGSQSNLTILTGDQVHDFDAERLKSAGSRVKQLNTGSSCHLDASMIQKELGNFIKPEPQLLIIENVGNLVCPAAFDLGESIKIALISCTEGEDKPSKYPLLFSEASLIILTKMDLVPHLDWKLSLFEEHIRRVNSSAPILHVSAKTETGLEPWLSFLEGGLLEQTVST
jgi:hydrogenase nickel incorporation protein HypB